VVINGEKAYGYFEFAIYIAIMNHDSFDDIIVSATVAVSVFFGSKKASR
jgi:hypothetical protein